ncbi:DUF445 domain-containing protein [Arenibaculum pallidiluteum]|uniref:DUF445 domain-containing protein n=1 Tax=Arenibaculum pallidiluteum TaxID=2812559 RepID=UPI001A959B28|nr:DUF445 domain-containing protein [Arenibaculum pallidiluteum]
MKPPSPGIADPDSRRLLRRNRALATGLLLLMATLFLGTTLVPAPGFWWQLLHATAEAAVVGALADWFAVTALFRHPLGLPIPHTAIVPRSKDRIGEGLGAFVERNFLDPDLVAARLRAAEPSRRLLVWLRAPGVAAMLADRITAALPALARSAGDDELRQWLGTALGDRLRGVAVAPLLGRVLEAVLQSGQHQGVVERLVAAALDYVERNEGRFQMLVGERTSWWVPRAVDRRVAQAVSSGLRELLADLLDPASLPRIRLEMAVEELARDLREDPDTRARVEAAKLGVLDHPEIQAWLGTLWDSLRDAALRDATDPEGRIRAGVTAALRASTRALAEDPALRRRLDHAVEAAALRLVVPWRRAIGRFIADVVRGWDARTVTERLEEAVGSDLQYVRISGTCVAALVGAALFLVTWALG